MKKFKEMLENFLGNPINIIPIMLCIAIIVSVAMLFRGKVAVSNSVSYETEAIIEEKSIQHHIILVGKTPCSTNSYELVVSIPVENGNDLKTTVTVSYSLYDALDVGDSVIVTVYTDKKTNELIKVLINAQ